MTDHRSKLIDAGVSRRGFLHGMAAAGTLAALPWTARRALAAPGPQPVLHGTEFALEIGTVPLTIDGRPTTTTGINGGVPAPTLVWREGDNLTLAVTNRLSEPSSIHWHGVRTPSPMDGVPGLSFRGIPPGETFVYRFPVHQSGTYWYHSHSMFQEQTGVYGPIVIVPKGGYAQPFDRDYIVMLSDWSFEAPESIVSNLKGQSDYYNFHQRTLGTFIEDASKTGLAETLSDRLMWGEMRMSPTDILDVSGATYTYLINGQGPGANWTALFKPGERVRLRFINGSSMSIFDVRIPGLPMTVVQSDGNDVVPVTVDEFRISVAETYDVIVQPQQAQAYTIFVQAEDRTGYARGTLAPRPGMAGPIPPMDPRPMRTMADMGMGDMGHGSMSSMDMGSMNNMPMDHGAMGRGAKPATNMGSMSNMPMDHGAMGHGAKPATNMGSMPAMEMRSKSSMPGMTKGGSKPAAPMDHGAMPGMPAMSSGAAKPLEGSVGVDNVAMMPTERLNSAGEGFPPGRRVLSYADLRATRPGDDRRPPTREITLHLTGNMQRFMWGFDGKKFSEAGPIELARGERVRFTLINDTMMEHPIHLHGLWSELDNGHDEYRPYKHTINVKPGEKLSYFVTADVPGRWAFHCHLLYHMEMGMFREVRVA
jgi:FtsP/CotA-like multicopper oxidase with cupredoxin domain